MTSVALSTEIGREMRARVDERRGQPSVPSVSPRRWVCAEVRGGMGEDRPGWAQRMIREREARGWSQVQAVSNLLLTYSAMNGGKEGGTRESLVRQWKEWESGRVQPKHWARFIAATFGTVER